MMTDPFPVTVLRVLCEVETEPLYVTHTWFSLQWVTNLTDCLVHSSVNTGNTKKNMYLSITLRPKVSLPSLFLQAVLTTGFNLLNSVSTAD